MMTIDTAFEMAASNIRFGPGVTREVGKDLGDLGAGRVMVVTDPVLADLPPVSVVLGSLRDENIDHVLFDRVRTEPTDASFTEAIGANVSGADPADEGTILADGIIAYMQRLDMPNGLSAVGYGREDMPALVNGTLPQHRVTKRSPRPVTEEDLTRMFEDALRYW